MPDKLHIDIETYSSQDLTKSGVYKYCESLDFEILLIAYSLNDEPINFIEMAKGEPLHIEFINSLLDPKTEKHAHNAAFERTCFKTIGYDIPASQWYCSMIKAAYCGLPLSLGDISKALELGEKGKLRTGKDLIRYFCTPCKPTKTNGSRHRNLPHHDTRKWEMFIDYCKKDVLAEKEIGQVLSPYKIPKFERINYILDQKINDEGILVDIDMANRAYNIDIKNIENLKKELKDLTGLENPSSVAQLKGWLSSAMNKEIKTLAAGTIPELIKEAESNTVKEVLALRQKSSKTSTKKYLAMLNCACEDNRARGLFQFYGANRTGRWAGRLIQLQNLKRNYLKDLEDARKLVKTGSYESVIAKYGDISNVLSQLIRTTFIAKKGSTFCVADFSAIEARVIAWLSNEKWRLDVFNKDGKIYEASASMMFGVPIEQIGKGSDLRTKGKVAELALGYNGSVGAMKQMGAEDMGLNDEEMKEIVDKWRAKSPNIVKLWGDLEQYAIAVVRDRRSRALNHFKGLILRCDGNTMTIQLPSGRKLFYQSPEITISRFDKPAVRYKGRDQTTGQWGWVDTYGGKLTENVVQAIARDLLANSMINLNAKGFNIVMHVHDEAACEVPISESEEALRTMCDIMGEEVEWAPGLPLVADGYITPFYKKD